MVFLTLLISAFTFGTPIDARALDAGDMLGYFYESLSPYGRWSEMRGYGPVWYPRQRPGWRPYSDGRWVWSDEYGWVWQPEEEWGDIPYHYGRWGSTGTSWYWVPDRVWGPAWVDWRDCDDYIGWAPLPPEESWDWRDEWRPSHHYSYYREPARYIFVPARHFTSEDPYRYVLPPEESRRAFERSRSITTYRIRNQRIVNEGPERRKIEQRSGRRIQPVKVEPHRPPPDHQRRENARGEDARRQAVRSQPTTIEDRSDQRRAQTAARAGQPASRDTVKQRAAGKRDKPAEARARFAPDTPRSAGGKDKSKKQQAVRHHEAKRSAPHKAAGSIQPNGGLRPQESRAARQRVQQQDAARARPDFGDAAQRPKAAPKQQGSSDGGAQPTQGGKKPDGARRKAQGQPRNQR